MSANVEESSQLVSVGIGQAMALLSQSFALLAYKRALTPLYSSVPASSYVSYVSIVSSILGSIVDVPTGAAALVYGSLLAAAPNTVYYVGRYTARWKDPILGPIVTHAIVLFPILMSGFALFQSAHAVRARLNYTTIQLLNIPLPLPAQGNRYYVHPIVPPPPHVVHIPVT